MKFYINTLCGLLVLAFFFSCGKGTPDSYNPYNIAPQEVIEETQSVDTSTFTNASLEHVTFVTNLLSNVSMIIYAHPALNGVVSGTTATVRSCPDLKNQVGTLPALTSLDFEFDNCSQPTGFTNIVYDGIISMTFDGSLGANNSEFTMSTTSFKVSNGTTTYTISFPDAIEFNYDGSPGNTGDFDYDYNLTGNIVVTDGTYTTTYPSGMMGQMTIIDNAGDDTMNPMTYIDNTFALAIEETVIVCNNGVMDMNVCAKTQSNKEITYALGCGCPQAGVLQLNPTGTGACSNYPNATQFDFGSDAAGDQEEECDNFVENGNSIVSSLTSCSG